MSDLRLIWDGARVDFGLLTGLSTGPNVAVFSSAGYISTPASAAVNTPVTAVAFELRAKLALTDWTPAADMTVMDQVDNAGTSTFYFNITTTGALEIGLSEDGGLPATPIISTATVPAANGSDIWIRTVLTPDRVTFYTSTDGNTWSTLGAPVPTVNGVGLPADVPLRLGLGRDVGGQLLGTLYRAEIRNGAGTLVAVFDPTTTAAGSTTVSASTGETWTLSGGGVAIEAEQQDAPAYELESDDGLETAVILSLFTDRRAGDGDVLPDRSADRRGWWGDAFPVEDGDQVGSLLWLLQREKQTPSVLGRVEQYAREALAWLLEDQVASAVEVTASNSVPGRWELLVTITRPKVSPVTYRFDSAWAAQAGRE